MIRVSRTHETADVVTLKVEGVLVTDWIPVLERACMAHLDQRQRVELEFEDVSFLDGEAVTAVRALLARGVTLLHPTPLVRHLLARHGWL